MQTTVLLEVLQRVDVCAFFKIYYYCYYRPFRGTRMKSVCLMSEPSKVHSLKVCRQHDVMLEALTRSHSFIFCVLFSVSR